MSNATWIADTVEHANLQIQAGNPRYAIQLLSELIQRETGIAAAYNTMSIAALYLDERDMAVQAAEEACRLAPQMAQHHYTFGRALTKTGRTHDAINAYRQAIRLSSNAPEFHVSLAIAYRRKGSTDKAMSAYRNALKLQPNMVEAIHNLANLQAEAGQTEAAEVGYRRALELRPSYAPSLYEMGNLAHHRGNPTEAESCYLAAAKAQPKYAKAWSALGNLKFTNNEDEEAETCLERALALQPADAKCLLLQGMVRARLQKTALAIENFQQCLEIDPNNVDALIQCGPLLRKTGQHPAAIALLQKAVSLARGNVRGNACFLLAAAFMDVDAYAEVEKAVLEGLELVPDEVYARLNLATAYRMMGRLRDANEQAHMLHDQLPDSVATHALLATIASDCGDVETASASFYRATVAAPDASGELGKFCMSLSYNEHVSLEDIHREHREYGNKFMAGLWTGERHPNLPESGRRLRVGYVSPDFRNHSVAWFLEPVLRAHDRNGFEVYGYHNYARSDAITERLRGLCDGWVDAVGLSDDQLAERIRTDGIDLLIDLAGHTAGNRLGVFARKPAPVQMTWLGYLTTTGVPTIDYRLTDAHVDPDGYEAWQVEHPLRLPDGYVCYGPPADAPQVGPLPANSQGSLTFGSFNNLAKLSHATLALWSHVLQAVPDSRLMLKSRALADPWVRERLTARFAEQGIAAERLILNGWETGRDAHLELYNRIDIGLDTTPYNGVTTTCEALWMGVPVLSRVGATQASRQGKSLLGAVGLEAWACADDAAFITKARAAAADLDGLARLRAGLRACMAASPLTDARGFTRHLERAYRQGWEQWCKDASHQDETLPSEPGA